MFCMHSVKEIVLVTTFGLIMSLGAGCSLFSKSDSEKPTKPTPQQAVSQVVKPHGVTATSVTFGHVRKITFEGKKAYEAALDSLHYRASRAGLTIEDFSGKEREIFYNFMDQRGDENGIVSIQEALRARNTQKELFLREEIEKREGSSQQITNFTEEVLVPR